MVNTIMRTTLKTSQKELIHSPLSKEELPCQESKNKRNGKIITRIPPLEFKEIDKSTKKTVIVNMLKKRMPNLMSSFKLLMSTTATKTTLKIFQKV
jgi:ribosomal protein L28